MKISLRKGNYIEAEMIKPFIDSDAVRTLCSFIIYRDR